MPSMSVGFRGELSEASKNFWDRSNTADLRAGGGN